MCNGFCAFTFAAKSILIPSNPETFKIIKGKLFLFFNGDNLGKNVNAKIFWNQNEAYYLFHAKKNWKELLVK